MVIRALEAVVKRVGVAVLRAAVEPRLVVGPELLVEEAGMEDRLVGRAEYPLPWLL